MNLIQFSCPVAVWLLLAQTLPGGPNSGPLNDPKNPYDAPVPGFIGPDGIGKARVLAGLDENDQEIFQNPNNFVNPLFFAWASAASNYHRSDAETFFNNPNLALGPVTGDQFLGVVSLGDLTTQQIADNAQPGTITLKFPKPIRNGSGADFVIFENGLISQSNTGGAGTGGILAELARVEVSADGVNFVRFPCTSLTPAKVGGYGSIDATDVFNLAGKHANSYGSSWGTPFDLQLIGLPQITHIRIVDIPGDGSSLDQNGRPIYDAWQTFGSGGFDLDAVGAISTSMSYAEWPQLATLDPTQRGEMDDPDGDGLPNLLEYAGATLPRIPDASVTAFELIEENGMKFTEFRFIRDERLLDLTYEVQVSGSMDAEDWATVATSTAGGTVLPASGQFVISESPASGITGISVIREVRVRSSRGPAPRYFFRVKVSQLPKIQ